MGVKTLPTGWELCKLGDFTISKAGGTPSTSNRNYWGGEIPWMNSGELNLKRVGEVAGRITELGLAESSTSLIPAGCVLVGLAGQGKTRGTVAINEIELCTNQSIAAIFPNEKFDNEYLFYNLEKRYDELRLLSDGGGGRGGLNLSIINGLIIPCPTIKEQKTISQALRDIDLLIVNLKNEIKKIESVFTGLLDTLLNVKMFSHAKSSNLGDLCNVKTGSRNNQDKEADGLYPFFVRSDTIEYINSYSYTSQAILVPGEGRIGEIFHYVDGPHEVHQRVYRISDPTPNVSLKYLYWYLKKYFGKHAMTNTVKATVDSLRLPTFLEFEIFFPDKIEQERIATILDDSNCVILSLVTEMQKYELIKQGMMHDLLTGKVRLV